MMSNLSEEERKSIEYIKNNCEMHYDDIEIMVDRIDAETILNLIEKQDKLINILAVQLTTPVHNKEWVIKYWTKILNTIEEK